MQYLLTQEELDALKKEKDDEVANRTHIINFLCMRIAEWEPVGGKPLGCIHNGIGVSAEYCDNCLVRSYCYMQKKWSKTKE
jgi:hypothetical protein